MRRDWKIFVKQAEGQLNNRTFAHGLANAFIAFMPTLIILANALKVSILESLHVGSGRSESLQ